MTWKLAFFGAVCLAAACGGTNPVRENADLASLALDEVTFSPSFSPGVSSYTAEVAAAVDSTRVTARAAVSSATIDVNGERVDSGGTTGPIALDPGVNTITIVVTARDRETQRTYTVAVTRRTTAASNANLSRLELTATSLDQVFDSEVTSYTASVGHIGASTRVIAAPEDAFASLEVQGNAIAPDDPSGLVFLEAGSNALAVDVTAEDATIRRTYAVEVTRGELDAVRQEAYVKASNPGPDLFGAAVSLSGDLLAVGAPEEASASQGIDGDEADNSAVAAGAVYVFDRAGTTWRQHAYVKASNPDPADRFGDSVSIADDTLVAGAPGEQSQATGVDGDQLDNGGNAVGAAYVFLRDAMGVWDQTAYLKASNSSSGDEFARAIDVNGDRLIIGAPFEDGGQTGVDGDEADRSAANAGAAYVFRRDSSGTWEQEAYLKASNTDPGDEFGSAVAISGRLAAVAAIGEDSDAAGIDGDEQNDSLAGAGAVYLFERDDDDRWTQVAYIKASNPDSGDAFGTALALDTDFLVAGAPFEDSGATGVDGDQLSNAVSDAGAAYVFERDSQGRWSQVAYVKASNTDANDVFGSAVALWGNVLSVGAPDESSFATGINGDERDNSAASAGAAYLFERDGGGSWKQLAYVKASNTDSGDEFGGALDLDGDTLAVGAAGEASDSAGVDGRESDNSLNSAGAVYVKR